jgi:hypothetical protein
MSHFANMSAWAFRLLDFPAELRCQVYVDPEEARYRVRKGFI